MNPPSEASCNTKNNIGAWNKPLFVFNKAQGEENTNPAPRTNDKGDSWQNALSSLLVPEPGASDARPLMEHSVTASLDGQPATNTAFLQGSVSHGQQADMVLPSPRPSNSGTTLVGWGGQAIEEHSNYRVPWFGRSHTKVKTPRTSKGQDPPLLAEAKASNQDALSAEDLLALIKRLPKKDPLPDSVFRALHLFDSRSMALLLKDLGRRGMDRRAAELFQHIRTATDTRHRQLHPLLDVYTFTAMVSMCIHLLDVDRALELLDEMQQRGIEPNVHTFTALINVCIKCGRLPLALQVYDSMRERGCMPNVVTYNALVDVYGKLGQWESAVLVVSGMKKEGVEPVLRTYNTLIIACNVCNQPREALAVCARLLADGFSPNSTTYNALISAYGKLGQLSQALDIYRSMARLHMERSVITYSSVISACEKAGHWETALEVFEEMRQDGCAPNTVTFNCLITACAQGGQWEKASQMFDQMVAQGCTPDVLSYTALISAFGRGGQWQGALRAFNRMCEQGCKQDVIVFNAIIDTLWQTGVAWAQRKALQLFSYAARQGHFRRDHVTSSADCAVLNLHAMTAGVAMLSLYTWLQEIRSAVKELGPQALPGSLMIVTDLGCRKEQANGIVKEAVNSMMNFWQTPFSPVQSPQYAAALEAGGGSVAEWVLNSSVDAVLASLLPVSDIQGPGVEEAMAGFEQQASRDCSSAFFAVQVFEQTHGLVLDHMCDGYVEQRTGLVSQLLVAGGKLGLRDEVVHDAVLLMDRVASEAKQVSNELLPLMGLAALSVASNGGSHSADTSNLYQLADVPPAALVAVEWNIRSLLRNDMSAISTMRCLKLYLERLGLCRLDPPSIYSLAGFGVMMSVEALFELPLLNCRPSVVAAALLYAERRLRGCVPFWPTALARLTGYDDMSAPELVVAARVSQQLARKAVYSQIYRAQMAELSGGAAGGDVGSNAGREATGPAGGTKGTAGGAGGMAGAGNGGGFAKSLSPTAAAFTPVKARAVVSERGLLAASAAAAAALAPPLPAGSSLGGLPAPVAAAGPRITALPTAAHLDQRQHHALPSLDVLMQAMQSLSHQDDSSSPATAADPPLLSSDTASSSSSPDACAAEAHAPLSWTFEPPSAATALKQAMWA